MGRKVVLLLLMRWLSKKKPSGTQKVKHLGGNIDSGTIKGEDSDNIATNLLVIMISSLKKPWCVPLAYFLTKNQNADILSQFILESIKMLRELVSQCMQ